jgi:hypothetical protein
LGGCDHHSFVSLSPKRIAGKGTALAAAFGEPTRLGSISAAAQLPSRLSLSNSRSQFNKISSMVSFGDHEDTINNRIACGWIRRQEIEDLQICPPKRLRQDTSVATHSVDSQEAKNVRCWAYGSDSMCDPQRCGPGTGARDCGDRTQRRKHVERARIVLASAERKPAQRVAAHAGVSRPTVWRWQQRYAEAGVEGLLRDRTRKPGKAPIAGETAARLVALTCTPPSPDRYRSFETIPRVPNLGRCHTRARMEPAAHKANSRQCRSPPIGLLAAFWCFICRSCGF